MAECSGPSPTIAGCGIALISGCGGKERVKLAPGPKLQGGASLLQKVPCLLDAPRGLAPPCLPQAPACLTDTEKQRKSAGGGSGRGAVGSFGSAPQRAPGKTLAAVRRAGLSSLGHSSSTGPGGQTLRCSSQTLLGTPQVTGVSSDKGKQGQSVCGA